MPYQISQVFSTDWPKLFKYKARSPYATKDSLPCHLMTTTPGGYWHVQLMDKKRLHMYTTSERAMCCKDANRV